MHLIDLSKATKCTLTLQEKKAGFPNPNTLFHFISKHFAERLTENSRATRTPESETPGHVLCTHVLEKSEASGCLLSSPVISVVIPNSLLYVKTLLFSAFNRVRRCCLYFGSALNALHTPLPPFPPISLFCTGRPSAR